MCNVSQSQLVQPRPLSLKPMPSTQGTVVVPESKIPSRRRPIRVKQLSSLQGFLLESDIFNSEAFSSINYGTGSSRSLSTTDESVTSIASNISNENDLNCIRILARDIRRSKRQALLRLSQQERWICALLSAIRVSFSKPNLEKNR
jgi:hypothetical protein